MSSKTKKFALIGTSCVGKTTLFHALPAVLIKQNPKLLIKSVPEAARLYFEKKHARDRFSYFHQGRIQNLAKRLEKSAHAKNVDIILCDRSVVDAIAYLYAMGNKNGAKKLLQKVKTWLPSYTHLFLLDPKDISYAVDAIRDENENIRNMFHSAFMEVLSELDVSYTLISGTIKKRLEKTSDIILNSK